MAAAADFCDRSQEMAGLDGLQSSYDEPSDSEQGSVEGVIRKGVDRS